MDSAVPPSLDGVTDDLGRDSARVSRANMRGAARGAGRGGRGQGMHTHSMWLRQPLA